MTGFIADDEFRSLLDWFMCSDPWPIAGDAGENAHHIIEELMNRYASAEHIATRTLSNVSSPIVQMAVP